MRDFIVILKRFIPPYKFRVIRSILFNLLQALFGATAIAMLSPIMGILFGTSAEVTEKMPFEFSFAAIKDTFFYYITSFKHLYGASNTLIFIGVFAILATALKTGFAYLASYETRYNLPYDQRCAGSGRIDHELVRHVLSKPDPDHGLSGQHADDELGADLIRPDPSTGYGRSDRTGW